MALASKGSLGTSVNTANNQASTTHTTATTTVSVGDLAVLIIAVDNNQTTDGDEGAVTSVTSTGNTWTKAVEFCNGQGAAQAGTTVSIWYCVAAAQINTGSAITINFSNSASRDESCSSGWCYTRDTTATLAVEATNTQAGDAQTDIAAALDATTANIQCLRIRGIASELNDATQMTATSSWTLFGVTRSANVATAQSVRGEFIINTATGASSNPTLTVASSDHAHAYVAFKEIADELMAQALL